MGGGQRSRGVPPGPVGQAEAFQLLGALTVDSHQGVVLLRQAAKLLLQAGDLDGDFLIFHQLRQQLPPKRKWNQQILLRIDLRWTPECAVLGSYVSLSVSIEKLLSNVLTCWKHIRLCLEKKTDFHVSQENEKY